MLVWVFAKINQKTITFAKKKWSLLLKFLQKAHKTFTIWQIIEKFDYFLFEEKEWTDK